MIIKSLISGAILKYVPFYCIKCMIFHQLIFRKIINFVATRCRILRLKFTKFNFGWGSLQRSHRPSSWWGGGSLPPPQKPHRRCRPFGLRSSALRASILGPSGLNTRPFGPRNSALRASNCRPRFRKLPRSLINFTCKQATTCRKQPERLITEHACHKNKEC